MSGAGI